MKYSVMPGVYFAEKHRSALGSALVAHSTAIKDATATSRAFTSARPHRRVEGQRKLDGFAQLAMSLARLTPMLDLRDAASRTGEQKSRDLGSRRWCCSDRTSRRRRGPLAANSSLLFAWHRKALETRGTRDGAQSPNKPERAASARFPRAPERPRPVGTASIKSIVGRPEHDAARPRPAGQRLQHPTRPRPWNTAVPTTFRHDAETFRCSCCLGYRTRPVGAK